MSAYAQATSVPVERSRAEIERTLVRYGAVKFGTWNEPGKAVIQFELKSGRQLQVPIPLPVVGEKRGTYTRWSQKDAEQETRRRWRVALLTIKALLEAVESRLLTVDQAFLAFIVVPGTGRTVGDHLLPRMTEGTWRLALTDGKETK